MGEDISKQQKPLEKDIQAEIMSFAAKTGKDSLEEAVANVVAAGNFLG